MNPDDLKVIEAKMEAASGVWYSVGTSGSVQKLIMATLDMEKLVAEVRQLYRDNILLLGEGDRLRTDLGEILVAVNAEDEPWPMIGQVRVIVTRALLGKSGVAEVVET